MAALHGIDEAVDVGAPAAQPTYQQWKPQSAAVTVEQRRLQREAMRLTAPHAAPSLADDQPAASNSRPAGARPNSASAAATGVNPNRKAGLRALVAIRPGGRQPESGGPASGGCSSAGVLPGGLPERRRRDMATSGQLRHGMDLEALEARVDELRKKVMMVWKLAIS